MIAKVCDHESRRDSWFENRLVTIEMKIIAVLFLLLLKITFKKKRQVNNFKIGYRNKFIYIRKDTELHVCRYTYTRAQIQISAGRCVSPDCVYMTCR